ncbi:hypothetical protein [Paenibacillus humicus]|uniref:hypothetical protein n=1 Tax=Paenibacillus humicus TaxID=412861 RepID=UPI000FD956A7|nr:hypothetical protein [Paenibacillus humicus]
MDQEMILAFGWTLVNADVPQWPETAPFPFVQFNKDWNEYRLYEIYEEGWPFLRFAPSTTWDGAGQVIEEMRRRGFNVLIGNHALTGNWVVEIGTVLVEDVESCPHAITVAAILALRSEAEHGDVR